ncbi:MAG: histidinol-phosphatase HisJ family protein [Clostridia bacterium]|nr:histidinol-phosphatase HisJ family protein [Clostridia bacterium]
MCEKACEKNVKAVAFTDHVETDCYYEEHYDKVAIQSYVDTVKARCAFSGKLIVCSGIELGEACFEPELAEKIITERKYDFVVASIHNLRDEQDFFFFDYADYDCEAILDEYFDEELNLVEWGKFDSLAHLTYPLRYMQGEQGIQIDMNRFKKKIDEILKLLAEKDKALEINTSGLFQKLRSTMPGEDIIKRYHELGGRLVTVGSDSHYAQKIGNGVQRGMELAKRCGFNSITLFKNREPIEIPIE